MDPSFIPYRHASSYLKTKLRESGTSSPSVGIVCGSGLSGLSDTLEGPTLSVKYGDIPGFPASCTVAGHRGEVIFGMLSGVPAMCFRGRFHSYEGHDMATVVLPVRVMRCLGVKVVIVTNAAGGLNPDFKVGDVITVTDHMAIPMLAGKNPLIGPNDDELGPRFPPTSNAYPESLRTIASKAAKKLNMNFLQPEGTYCFVSGPMYESKAECRFLRNVGGDAVGMSTVPEIVSAHHSGMKILCLSLITNKVIVSGDEGPAASHAEVLEAVQNRSVDLQALVKEIVSLLQLEILPSLPDLPQVTLESENSVGKKGPDDISIQSVLSGLAFFALGVILGAKVLRKQ